MSKENIRIKELDGLRGIAIIWVLISHLTFRFGELYQYSSAPILQISNGTLGVELFFIISGFVIFMTLENTLNLKSFIVNRIARLYPSFLFCAPLTFLIVYLFGLPGREVQIKDAIINFSFIANILGFKFIDGAYWSLEVEVVFYATVSIVFFLAGARTAFLVIKSLVCIYILINLFDIYAVKESYLFSKIINLKFMPFFLIGIAYYNFNRKRERSLNSILILIGCLCSLIERGVQGVILTMLLSFIFGLAICYGSKLLVSKPLIFFGYISYSLYLVHQNISYVIIRTTQNFIGVNLSILIALTMSILLATFITYFIEKPMMVKIKTGFLGHNSKYADQKLSLKNIINI